MQKLKENKLSSSLVYKGSFLKVKRDQVLLPNHKIGIREYVDHPGASVIIPMSPNNKIILIRQFRYAMKSEFLELPAGKLNKNETPLDCAHRELKEECGYNAGEMKFLTTIHPAIGFSNEVMNIYFATNLKKIEQFLDEDEFLELVPMELNIAMELIWEGTITDVKTIIGLLWLDKNNQLLK